MINLTLKRRPAPGATFGELYHGPRLLCFTVEREWANNRANVSCVPAGEYFLKPHQSPTHGRCLALEAPTLGVTRYGPSQRTHILIHPANRADQLEGCIAPGMVQRLDGVGDSKRALDKLLYLVGEETARLIITHC
ncbi:DUF5675 family protein [Ferrimonas balearica]|uniref:DUF5675 family protein n=1 Tax=Ferrimonas balearica TaxID=44012 RepID=UPI001C9535AD